ncbi:tRNA (cytosine-5-)-methyltransferase ncl1 [Mucor velutinosus]|uniref:tRNA (Cytosine-5-)-methyltransferase ncl1 n=1 Tax=Mucor velutinosus TaxID=708070 RepID=A0AAN7DP50_9FUNG|nr:tRNA (cytosine-5-)-methyltransferase ncl1 [Mucor velutinosus]
MSVHCGNKFVCHNVFRSLFMATTKPNLQRRKLSTLIMEQVKHTTLATETTSMNAIASDTIAMKIARCKQMSEYNQRLKAHASKFRKRDQSQLNAVAIIEEMKEKGFQPTSQNYLQLLMGISLQRHRTHKQNQRMELWFEELLRLELLKRNPWPKLKKAVMAMSLKGHPNMKAMFLKLDSLHTVQDSACWNAAIMGCVRDRQLQDAEELLTLAQERNLASSESYQILIDVYLFLQDQPSASRIFSLMIQHNVAADFPIFESFISYYMSLPTNDDTFRTLDRLWQAVLLTSTHNIPDDMIFKLLSYYGLHGELSRGEQVYLDVKSRHQKLDRRCLGQLNKIIIGFCNKRQLPSALSLMYDLVGQGYNPSSRVLCKIINACKDMDDREAAQQLITTIQQVDPGAKLAQQCFDALDAQD